MVELPPCCVPPLLMYRPFKVAMGWEVEESAAALLSAGGDVVGAAEALAAKEEEDLERYHMINLEVDPPREVSPDQPRGRYA